MPIHTGSRFSRKIRWKALELRIERD